MYQIRYLEVIKTQHRVSSERWMTSHNLGTLVSCKWALAFGLRGLAPLIAQILGIVIWTFAFALGDFPST